MPIYGYTSINNVFAKIIRDTGLVKSEVVNDMMEWVPEALDHMQVQLPAGTNFQPLKIRFHAAKLPTGIITLNAVEYRGKRLRERDNANDPRLTQQIHRPRPTGMWATNPASFSPTVGVNETDRPTLLPIFRTPWEEKAFFTISGGAIMTSFPEGEVIIHYDAVPTDEEGFPLIPDNAALREAIYYYVRLKMVASNSFEDKFYSPDKLMLNFEQFAARAIEQITYPTPDQMHSMDMTLNRLVKSQDYWRQFDNPGLHEKFYGIF